MRKRFCDVCEGEIPTDRQEGDSLLEISLDAAETVETVHLDWMEDICQFCIIEAIGKQRDSIPEEGETDNSWWRGIEQCIHGIALGDECKDCVSEGAITPQARSIWTQECKEVAEYYSKRVGEGGEVVVPKSYNPQSSPDSYPVDKRETLEDVVHGVNTCPDHPWK